jgi:gamma-glutamylcyclotransferase (GGCT)/AIG2-like uncharacterized protein YtfP
MDWDVSRGRESVVFVYGTLLRGESNHFRLSRSDFLGEAATAPLFALRDMGGFPALIEGGTQSVQGEVYAVTRETLCLLDELEEHPVYYRRSEVRLSDGRGVMAYLLPAEKARHYPVIESGSWRLRGARPGFAR